MAALCLSARQLAMHVDLMSKINGNLQNIKTVLESGEDEWSLLWKSIHHPWVIIWESFYINLIIFLVGGTSVVTGDRGHKQKINCVYINLIIKRKNELWDIFSESLTDILVLSGSLYEYHAYFLKASFMQELIFSHWELDHISEMSIWRRHLFFSHSVRAKIQFPFFPR